MSTLAIVLSALGAIAVAVFGFFQGRKSGELRLIKTLDDQAKKQIEFEQIQFEARADERAIKLAEEKQLEIAELKRLENRDISEGEARADIQRIYGEWIKRSGK